MLVTIQEFYNVGEAHIVAARLEQHGIQSNLLHENTAGSFGVAFLGTAGVLKLQIHEEDFEKAEKLLNN